MDEFEAFDSQTVAARLKFPGPAQRLYEIVSDHQGVDYSTISRSGTAVAGPGLEFSSGVTCGSFKCQKKMVDGNYGQVLHYFDYVAMEGPSTISYLSWFGEASDRANRDLTFLLGRDVDTFSYVRSVGLDQHIMFVDKACSCRPHLTVDASTLGLEGLIEPEAIIEVAKRLSREGRVFIRQDGPREWFGVIRDPLFDGLSGTRFNQKTRPKKVEVAATLVSNWLGNAISNSATAYRLKVPLTSLGAASFPEVRPDPSKLRIEDIAARIHIPVLANMPTKDFIALRNQEHHHFEKFRSVLREAIVETMSKLGDESPEVIADHVWQSKVRPAVADIERKIAASNRSLRVKVVTAAAIGSVAAAIGAITDMAWLIGIGTVAAGTPLPQAFKSYEDKQAIQISDMYFLWKAANKHD